MRKEAQNSHECCAKCTTKSAVFRIVRANTSATQYYVLSPWHIFEIKCSFVTNNLITEIRKVRYKSGRTLGKVIVSLLNIGENLVNIFWVVETIPSYCAAESIESVANPRALDDFF